MSAAAFNTLCAALMSLAYYVWGGWRSARMLPAQQPCVGCPAEVGGQPPAAVAAAVTPGTAGLPLDLDGDARPAVA